MRRKLFNPRFRLYATLGLSLAIVIHIALATWAFAANATHPEWLGRPPGILMSIEPSIPWFAFIVLFPLLLFLAALIVSGGYRRTFLAGCWLVLACLIVTNWIVTFHREARLYGGNTAFESRLYRTRGIEITSGQGGLKLQYAVYADWRRAQTFPLVLTYQFLPSAAQYPFANGSPAEVDWHIALHPLGIEVVNYTGKVESTLFDIYSVTLPHWLLLLFCLPYPALWLYRRLRPRATDLSGHCAKCGYDLRAHLQGQAGDKCPECGTPVKS